MDQSKEATFKVAPSKWEAVDEAELESQGEPSTGLTPPRTTTLLAVV